MDEFAKELAELKQFIVELKADRAAVKEKERREGWVKYVSLTVVVIAVMASIASQWAGKYSSRAQTSQSHAFDKWNLYEAKSIKQHLDVLARPLLRGSTAADSESAKVLQQVEKEIPRYDGDKAQAKTEAEDFEAAGKAAGVKGGKMGMAVSLLSVSIAMASMCLVTKKRPLWLLAILLAAVGVGEMAWAWAM